MTDDAHTGGCMCGALRFRAEGPPMRVGLCHCETCRRNTGSSFLAFAAFARGRFFVERGETGYYQSSPEGRRHFCRQCGSPLFSEWTDTESRDVYLGALDAPERLRPSYELPWGGRAAWLPDMPDLKRFARDLPEDITRAGGAP